MNELHAFVIGMGEVLCPFPPLSLRAQRSNLIKARRNNIVIARSPELQFPVRPEPVEGSLSKGDVAIPSPSTGED